jgi:uncharacterized protein
MQRLTRILSIDGGGIRGIIPGEIIIALEEKLKILTKNSEAKIADYFDFIAGTSTGGIMTCLFLCPEEKGSLKPRLSAKEVVDFYYEYAGEIFTSPILHKIKSIDGLIDEKYPSNELEKVLDKYFKNLELKDLIKPCLIPAYDIEKRCACFFTQHTAEKSKKNNFLIRDIARGTSAAPTFFAPVTIHSLTGKPYNLIDGGVFAGNPGLCAYIEARKLENHPEASQMLILSLGTGQLETPYKCKEADKWGKLQWIEPMIDILLSGSTDINDYQLQKIFESVDCNNQYLRINPVFDNNHKELNEIDNVSKGNLEALKSFGKKTAIKYDKKLDEIVKLLIENHDYSIVS